MRLRNFWALQREVKRDKSGPHSLTLHKHDLIMCLKIPIDGNGQMKGAVATNGLLHSNENMNELPTPWMNLTGIMLSKRNQMQKSTHCMTPHLCKVQNGC